MSPSSEQPKQVHFGPARTPLGAIAASVLLSPLAAQAAAQLGSGLISYAEPIILFLGAGAIIVALIGSVFKPELVKMAVWAAVILVVVFFILRNLAALQSAVQS